MSVDPFARDNKHAQLTNDLNPATSAQCHMDAEDFCKQLHAGGVRVQIAVPGGVCLSFGWSTNGMGKTRGYEIEEILLVAHGGARNDTICMAERKK